MIVQFCEFHRTYFAACNIASYFIVRHITMKIFKMQKFKFCCLICAFRIRPVNSYIFGCFHPCITVMSFYQIQIFQIKCTFIIRILQFCFCTIFQKFCAIVFGCCIFDNIIEQQRNSILACKYITCINGKCCVAICFQCRCSNLQSRICGNISIFHLICSTANFQSCILSNNRIFIIAYFCNYCTNGTFIDCHVQLLIQRIAYFKFIADNLCAVVFCKFYTNRFLINARF